MPSLCCFWCPSQDYSERTPNECCPSCGRPYELPLHDKPSQIENYKIKHAVSRGFYSVVYRAEQLALGRVVVLKVVPTQVYEYFAKDWNEECREHARLGEGSTLVADITDKFDSDVSFGDSVLRCHVAVLKNVEGPTLGQLIKGQGGVRKLTSRMAAQIGADLFEIFHYFTENKSFHNDLHDGNILIESLARESYRSSAIDETTRAVAIDLGSVLDASKSDSDSNRLGDQHQIAKHLFSLAKALQDSSDIDYRLASALRGLAEHLAPPAGSQRMMTRDEARAAIEAAVNAADEPWRVPLQLQRFGDGYNAQTLESWHVPDLWFDPEGRWMAKTSGRGPQVITGMRGCGKTILLRALHFHARATTPDDMTAGYKSDDFIGIYSSCQKLLNPQDNASTISAPFERLYVAYLRDGIQVLRHLRSIESGGLLDSIDMLLRDALKPLDIPLERIPGSGEHAFDDFLIDLQFQLADETSDYRLKMAPADAFSYLADVLRAAAPAFNQKYILYLLDDVSTRYLSEDTVREVISKLLFQHAHCAFRITTEAQALHRVLLSPGGEAPADPNRDYEEFDLGNEVYGLLRKSSTQQKMKFVEEILRRKGQKLSGRNPLYKAEPREVLGDVELEVIAREIANSSATSRERKRVYRGLRALQAVCVGDIGDVLRLYEKILQQVDGDSCSLPVSDERQTDCFLEHSAHLLHNLNRRDQHKKGLALAFAQAAGELLKLSANQVRLRQYTKLYVRVDAGHDFDKIYRMILDLLDTGVFVYDGGVPRTKTRDDDPVLQFKLSYRKTLGLASFIGLSDRDRFELSGNTLREWLEHPENAKNILIESEARRATNSGSVSDANANSSKEGEVSKPALVKQNGKNTKISKSVNRVQTRQLSIIEKVNDLSSSVLIADGLCVPSLGISINHGVLESWAGRDVDTVLLALGFEERAKASAERLLATVTPKRVILLQYDTNQGADILKYVSSLNLELIVVGSVDDVQANIKGESIIVDTSGLSKPYIFVSIMNALVSTRRVGVVHTSAMEYFPSNQELVDRGVLEGNLLSNDVLASLDDILTGEVGPYRHFSVHSSAASPERWRALIASASPKNDRLLHLLDARSSDATRILVPPKDSPRRRIAWFAAELAASAAEANVGLIQVGSNDLKKTLEEIEKIYCDLYFRSGANVEVGLTGSKIHAVAFAALAAATRVSEVWYVEPRKFNHESFSKGVGETVCFDIELHK